MRNDANHYLLIRPKIEEDYESHRQDYLEVQGQSIREGAKGNAGHL